MNMMAPTRWTLFLSASAALWCCCSITIAAAAAAELTPRAIQDVGGIYVIDLNKSRGIGVEKSARDCTAGCTLTFAVRRSEVMAINAIESLNVEQSIPLLGALQRMQENSLEVEQVGGGWFGPVGVWCNCSSCGKPKYAVYLFHPKRLFRRIPDWQTRRIIIIPDPPPLRDGQTVRLPLYSPRVVYSPVYMGPLYNAICCEGPNTNSCAGRLSNLALAGPAAEEGPRDRMPDWTLSQRSGAAKTRAKAKAKAKAVPSLSPASRRSRSLWNEIVDENETAWAQAGAGGSTSSAGVKGPTFGPSSGDVGGEVEMLDERNNAVGGFLGSRDIWERLAR